MPVDLCGCMRDMSNRAFGSPILNSILGSSIFLAILIAFIMIILIMVMYPAKKGTPFTVIAKMFLYMTFSSLLVIFLHDGVIKFMAEEERELQLSEAFMRNITEEGRSRDPVYGNVYRPINPVPPQLPPQPQPVQPSPPPPQPETQPVPVKGGTDMVISAVEGGAITGGRVLRGPAPPRYTANPYA